MNGQSLATRDSTRIILDPPTFSPPEEMRREYLQRRMDELTEILALAQAGEWKPVFSAANHVRGTGAMYGFGELGDAAENLVASAREDGTGSLSLLQEYAEVLRKLFD